MRRTGFPVLILFFLAAGLGGCLGAVLSEESPSENDASGSVTQRTQDISGKMALALGGMAPGWELLTLDESPNSLDFTSQDVDLFQVSVPVGFDSYIEARSAEITPVEVGIGYVTPIVNARERDPIQVTTPPQKLIQILVGEARGQLTREATLDKEGQVKRSSVSVTGNAVAAVIRNRIQLINEAGRPGLFKADPEDYEADPPLSYYEAVIEGGDGVNYQFSPVDPEDPTHEKYRTAANRAELDDEDDLIAYDQALLTAADIFNEDTEDPTGSAGGTGGAFAFYSPSEAEFEVLQDALTSGTLTLPSGAGTSNAAYPSLAPIQILILSEVASATTVSERPSFVFVRERNETDPAVTDVP